MTTATVAGTGVRTAAVSWVWTTNMRLGGGLLVVAGATVLMGIITAEALYPGTFSTGANEISDLGGTRPPSSVILQPSATIFDVSMALIGLLVTAGAWFVHRAFGRRSVTIPLATLGLGALGVGLFPGTPAIRTPSSRWSRSSPAGSRRSPPPGSSVLLFAICRSCSVPCPF